MNIKELNRIPIKAYLSSKGIYPVKDRGYYGMYHSLFREDHNASMKVDYDKNLWIDFGSNDGGTMIDLVMRINNCSLKQAVDELKGHNSTSVNQYNSTTVQQQNLSSFHGINVISTGALDNPALFDYLKERCINPDIAKQYCKEIHYAVNNKEYYAIGFRNDTGGWELRNRNFKGSSTPKNITTISNDNDAVMLFEGFMDFLSYLSLKQNASPTIDSAILNSLANLPKAIPFLQTHQTIHAFLDNDEAGKRAVQCLSPVCKKVVDQSVFYRNHKDLNDYWRDISNPKDQLSETEPAVRIKWQIPVKKKGHSL